VLQKLSPVGCFGCRLSGCSLGLLGVSVGASSLLVVKCHLSCAALLTDGCRVSLSVVAVGFQIVGCESVVGYRLLIVFAVLLHLPTP